VHLRKPGAHDKVSKNRTGRWADERQSRRVAPPAVQVRAAGAHDANFLASMLAVGADWRSVKTPRPVEEILAISAFGHYIDGWPRPGELGVVAVAGSHEVGAAWYRFLPAYDRGYGYVAEDIPELTIGVVATHRRRGIGEALLRRLLDQARRRGVGAVSLSVELDNPARNFYRRCGFEELHQHDGAVTMVRTF